MAVLEPVSVGLKFAFLVVLYLFLLWVVRSSLKDLRRDPRAQAAPSRPVPSDATALHSAAKDSAPAGSKRPRRGSVVEQAPGLESGAAFDLVGGAVLGRGDAVEIHLEDPFASTRHARISWAGSTVMIEDLGSTNGTYLNERAARRPAAAAPRRPDPHRRQRVLLPGHLDAARRRALRRRPTPAAPAGPTRTRFYARAPLFAVADGMGGAQAGEVASRTAVDRLAARPARRRHAPRSGWRARPRTPTTASTSARRGRAARRHGHDADRRLRRRATSVSIAHVGDSPRLPAARRRAAALTNDHSLVDEMVRRGKLTAERGRGAPAALDHHPRARPRARGRGRPLTTFAAATATCSCSAATG